MRFAVISDIHGNRAALSAVLAAIQARGVRHVLNLGDSFSGPLDPAGTARLLLPLNLPTVMGNHDRMLLETGAGVALWEKWALPEMTDETLDWIRHLPATRVWNGVRMTHGTPGDDSENWLDRRGSDARMVARTGARVAEFAVGVSERLILCGHTHTPRMIRLRDGRVVVNPGSVGMPAYLDDRFDPPFIHETGAPDARYAIVESYEDDWQISLCTVPYDPADMIERARSKGADTWATALSVGWFT